MIDSHKHPTCSENLDVLLKGLMSVDVGENVKIDHMTVDSRNVGKGGLFFAMPGTDDDGRRYVEQAINAGASAVIYDSVGWSPDERIKGSLIGVDNLREHIGSIADVFYGQPSSKMHVVGITGTNGSPHVRF